jgi:hypothetical protein
MLSSLRDVPTAVMATSTLIFLVYLKVGSAFAKEKTGSPSCVDPDFCLGPLIFVDIPATCLLGCGITR